MTSGSTPVPGRFLPAAAAAREPIERWVPALLVALVLAWAWPMVALDVTPPWDNVEELFWSGSLQWGYYKHPPLPSWLLSLPVALLGRQPWLTYVAGVGCGVGALYLLWRWSREMMTPARAAFALLLGTLVTYHVQRAVVYNHNTVQLLPLAGYWWMLWRVLRPAGSGRADWVWLGLFAALSMLTKYSAAVQFAVGLGFVVRQGLWRDARVRRDLLLATGLALLLLSPHLWWVLQHGDTTVLYARHSVHSVHAPGRHLLPRPVFVLLVQLARLSPMLLFIGWAWFAQRREAATQRAPLPAAFDRRFLAWATLGPTVLVLVASALLHSRLIPAWLTTFFLPLGVWAAASLPWLDVERWSRRRWQAVLAVAGLLHIATAWGYAGVDGVWSARTGRATRANLPSQRIAAAVEATWRDRMGERPLTLLVGDTWFAGAVALRMDPGVRLLIDGDERTSPWLAPGVLAREGGMVLMLDTRPFQAEGPLLEPLMKTVDCAGSMELPWTGEGPERRVRLRWGIVLAENERGAPGIACGHDPQASAAR
ncbi:MULTISPECIES: glycosyltransferase family 39 protein [Variovorax]|jgi:hypothetical protein|uniref:glycosyltransferase family 39 protein n=1 Tax=Variovorax TaxID=34072 RepID=UPI00247837C7|nr:glycosyltransferase family 39 protein [Variovorax sp.]